VRIKEILGVSSENGWRVVRHLTGTIGYVAQRAVHCRSQGSLCTSLRLDTLLTCASQALQYILTTSGYSYPKCPEARALLSLLLGKGIAWAEGSQAHHYCVDDTLELFPRGAACSA